MLIACSLSLAFTVLNPTGYSSLGLLTLFDSDSMLNTPEEYRIINSGVLLKVKRSHRNLLFPITIAIILYNLKCLFLFFKVVFDPRRIDTGKTWNPNEVLMALAGAGLFLVLELFLPELKDFK